MRDPFRDFLSRFMPWYDPDEAEQHDGRTEAIRQRSIRVRMTAERIRESEQVVAAVRNTAQALQRRQG